MKLVSFSTASHAVRVGALLAHEVVALDAWVARADPAPCAMAGLLDWLGRDARNMESLQAAVAAAGPEQRLALGGVHWHAPVPRPGKIVALGRNYADHAEETGVQPFEQPRIISKFGSSVVGPGAQTARPAGIAKLDFEIELAVVIGRRAKSVARQDALAYVAGYTILNDLSAREFQFDVQPAQTTFAKSMDGFCPMGPYLLTADELPDPQTLELELWLNGQRMQHGHTRDMLFPVARQIEYISHYLTLEPGDVIATGTPAGIGAFRTPPVWLQPGDRLELSITGLGTLAHSII